MMVMVILTFVLGGVIGDVIIGNQTIKMVVVLIVRIVIQITMIFATRLPRT
jgi:uncharacterized membrane protein YcaP (DUF421 family)